MPIWSSILISAYPIHYEILDLSSTKHYHNQPLYQIVHTKLQPIVRVEEEISGGK